MGKKIEFHTFLSDLPDEIIINILSRLPAKTAARCRLVCKLFKDLTFSRCFLDLHSRNTIPIVLVTTSFSVTERRSRCDFCVTYYTHNRPGIESFAIDNWWESDESDNWWESDERLFIHHPFSFGIFPNACRALFSHSGFLVLLENELNAIKSPVNENDQVCFVIVNPVTPLDYTRISLPVSLYKISKEGCNVSLIYGVYFHPVLKEYCSLWKLDESEDSERFHYKILTLGSNPSFRTISNPFDNTATMEGVIPLSIDNHLYWMLDPEEWHVCPGRKDVMEFDIINEEFRVIPCPVPLNTKCFHDQTHLLDIDGILSYVLILSGKFIIWRLGDDVNNSWIAAEYTFSKENWYNRGERVDVIVVRDGKLAIMSQGTLYVCNLADGTVNRLQTSKYSENVSFLSHQMSLASLNNCKSTIFIDINGEVVRDSVEGSSGVCDKLEEGSSVVRDKQELETLGSRDSMEGSSSSNGLAS